MDAIEFIKEYYRICEAHENCVNCPFEKEETDVPCDLISKNAERIVEIVEQWSKSHPQKTMIQDFFEKFPNAPVSLRSTEDYKIPIPCPCDCGYVNNSNSEDCDRFNGNCVRCWSRPLEES